MLPRQPTVLLIEDDELVRDAMTRTLVREGWLVLGAPTGHDAVGTVRSVTEPIPPDRIKRALCFAELAGASTEA